MNRHHVTVYENWNTRFYDQRKDGSKPAIREKLLKYGAHSMTDLELMTALLGTGTKDRPVEQLASEALQVILTCNPDDWQKNLLAIKGLGATKTAVILAAFESGSRLSSSREIRIRTPSDLSPLLQPYALEKQEHFIVVSLNGAHEILGIKVISVGTVNCTLVHPRDVFSEAVRTGASSLIVAHNHPSGTLEPSIEDYQLTERLIQSAKALGLPLLDHLIITKTGFFSFREETRIFSVEVLVSGEQAGQHPYSALRDSPFLLYWLDEIRGKPYN